MLLLAESQIDSTIRHRRMLLIGGLLLVGQAVALPREWGCGALSGFMVFSLGIYAVALQKWRTDPGLWMFAVLLTITLGPCSAYFEYLHWRWILAPPQANQLRRVVTWDQMRTSVDAAIALLLLARAIRLAATVGIKNWQRTHVIKQTPEKPLQSGV